MRCAFIRRSPTRSSRGAARACLATGLLLLAGMAAGGADDGVTLGAGRYFTKPKSGLLGGDVVPPRAEFLAQDAVGRAVPTNQWYSSVIFERDPHPIHALPMTYRAGKAGFEIGMPTRLLHVIDAVQREVRYPHVAAIVASPLGFTPQDARLARSSDWLAQFRLAAADGSALTATVLHGSPFSYYDCSSGDMRFKFSGKPRLLADPAVAGADARVAAFTLDGHSYAIFAPSGATWEWRDPSELLLHFGPAGRYFSIAGLPDELPGTLREFLAAAYVFPTDTRVDWRYDRKSSTVESTFTVTTVAKEGKNLTTFMGLYPHQWNALVQRPDSHHQYDSVRGPIRLITGNTFTLRRTYHGIMPYWAGLEDPADRDAVDRLLAGDGAKASQLYTKRGRGTYWVGKGIGATAQLLSVAQAEGKQKMADSLLEGMKSRMQSWFDGNHPTYFMQDAGLGTFVGYPEEYSSIGSMNDHHFHYGYWLTGAAHIALRDPEWLAPAKWGGMVGKIVADIANDERGRADFPFLRNFDPYEGHSWASGNAAFDDGNNQESSSEAVNAWAALILLGEATGNERLRDLGIYLYTSEIGSVQTYWFDLRRQVLGADYGKPFASMVFGGRYAYNTWWTEEPRQILGINALPITPASLYLGRDPDYVTRVFDDLPAEVAAYQKHGVTDGTPGDIWQDILASYLAIANPAAGAGFWNHNGTVESGETRSHTLYWLLSLKEMGKPDFTVTADTALYAVFKTDGGVPTYLAYNASNSTIHVTFSSGKEMDVGARSLVRSH